MWEIRDQTPFSSAGIIVIDKMGEKHWVVVVKGTFEIALSGETEDCGRADRAKFLNPEYRGMPGESSLLYEQDLLPAKPRTDVYLNATAHAPIGHPATQVLVGCQVAIFNKKLIVRMVTVSGNGIRWQLFRPLLQNHL